MKKLIYVMDPHCGWCYGNSSNITEIEQGFSHNFNFELITGGMWLGDDAPIGGIKLSKFIKSNSSNLILRTGISMSPSFYTLAENNNYSFSSLEPCAAITLTKSTDPKKVFFLQKKYNLLFL